MSREARFYTTQKINPHNRIVKGVAATKPRAKLRPGLLREGSRTTDWCSASNSFMRNTLSIMGRSLLLLGRLGQKFDQLLSTIWRKNIRIGEHSAQGKSTDPNLLSKIWDEIKVIMSIIRSARSDDPERQKKVDEDICVGLGGRPGVRLVTVRCGALMLVGLLAAPQIAFAQAPKVETPIDLFDTQRSSGVRIAPSLLLNAGTEADIYYDTNIYNDEIVKRDDTVGVLMPRVQLATDLARHGASLLGTAEIRHYFKTSAEDSEQFQILGHGWLDLGSRISFTADAGIAERIERRGTAGDLFNTDKPIQYSEKMVAAEIARTGGQLEYILSGSLIKRTFDDPTSNGVPIDLGYRDAVVREITGRVNYKLSPKISLYAEGSGNQVDYSEQAASLRNSSGYAVLGGIHYQVSSLIDVEGAVGYIHQFFDDPLLKSAKGLNYQLKASWTPTAYWKITATGNRAVDPSPLSSVPAIIYSDLELKVQRALSDKLLLESSVAYINEDYRNASRTDRRYIVDGALLYRLMPHILTSLHAGYRKQDSTNPGLSYEGASVGLTVNLTI